MTSAFPERRVLATDALLLALLPLSTLAWFAGGPDGIHPAIPIAALVVAGLFRLYAAPPRPSAPHRETVVCLLLAFLYRLPALLDPWGFVNKDGAYAAFVTLHLQQGVRPAPVFTEGANYQGTLKGHIGAVLSALTGATDLSWLVVAASVVLYLVFVAASMALARRIGGRTAAWVAGIYLALSPRFLTVFSVNSVGQYVDVLALGGLALALLARLLDEKACGREARMAYVATGLLLGAAFWQQPVAAAYALAAGAVLLLRRATWRDPWTLLVPVGALLGALPVLIWNAQNHWDSSFILGRDSSEMQAQIEGLPGLVAQTVQLAFPVLAGRSPNHPWGAMAGVRLAATLLLPAILLGYLVLRAAEMVRSVRSGAPSPALLPALLVAANLALFWSVASGMVYRRPRYLLPVLAAVAVQMGVVAAAAWRRPVGKAAVCALMGLLVAFNAAGTVPRLVEAGMIAADYRRLVEALDRLQIRTAYSDFSISAPVTMFTRERILVSPRLGPTPAYESESLARRVDRVGADAYILPPSDDPQAFAAELRRHGIAFRLVLEPLPIFYGLTPRIRAEEVRGFRGEVRPRAAPDE